ncbi:protein SIEVE ELEMENT OCCLUSION B-like [Fagus crenata]
MASNEAPVSIDQPNLTLSHEILTCINTHSASSGQKLNVESLFSVVENILNRATKIVDKKSADTQETMENLVESPTKGFVPPLCALIKDISSELNCKAPTKETALSIFKKLSSYSTDEKAVLTLATFALDYGELCLLANIQSTDQLAKSMGTLRGVPNLLENVEKHREVVDDLKKVIKTTLEVIQCIFKLRNLLNNGKKGFLAEAVYWAIETIVASTNQLCYLISNEGKKQELQRYDRKLKDILTELKNEITTCTKKAREKEDYWTIKERFRDPMDIMDVIEQLIDPKQQLTDASTNTMVDIDVLKGKNVFLFISGQHISKDDISILEPIFDKIVARDQDKILWISVEEQWTKDMEGKFEILSSKTYIARYSLTKASRKFIVKKWHFRVGPLIVVLSPQGKVECKNAIHMMRVVGVDSFPLPFTIAAEDTLLNDRGWIGLAASHVHQDIKTWIKENKYIFLYGGQNESINQFTKSAKDINAYLKSQKGISIELVPVQGDNFLKRFWSKIKNLFISRTHRETKTDSMMLKNIQKLSSYEEKKEWAVLTKGSSVIIIGGEIILEVMKKFPEWKNRLDKEDFDFVFSDWHTKLESDDRYHICYHINVPYNSGKISEIMNCSSCGSIMETYIGFKCCHDDGAAKPKALS